MKLWGAVSDVALARIIEQGALFLSALLLAAGADPEAFATAAVLLVITSAAATLADAGVGLQLLRSTGVGVPLPMRRAIGASVSASLVAIVTSAFFSGDIRTTLGFGGAIWGVSAVLQVSRSIVLRSRFEQLVLRSSLAGSITLLGFILLLPISNVGVIAGVGLVAKLCVEIVGLGRVQLLMPSEDHQQSWLVVGNQALNFTGANIDFLLVALILGPTAFAIYSLAFRVSSGLYSIGSFTIGRLGTVRLAAVQGPDRSAYLHRLIVPVFGIGLAGSAITFLAAPLLTFAVDDRWSSTVLLIRILAFMLPFRLLHGLFGAAFLVEHADRQLLKIEVFRIIASLVLLSLAATRGLTALSVAALALAICATVSTGWFLQRTTSIQLAGTRRVKERTVEGTPFQ